MTNAISNKLNNTLKETNTELLGIQKQQSNLREALFTLIMIQKSENKQNDPLINKQIQFLKSQLALSQKWEEKAKLEQQKKINTVSELYHQSEAKSAYSDSNDPFYRGDISGLINKRHEKEIERIDAENFNIEKALKNVNDSQDNIYYTATNYLEDFADITSYLRIIDETYSSKRSNKENKITNLLENLKRKQGIKNPEIIYAPKDKGFVTSNVIGPDTPYPKSNRKLPDQNTFENDSLTLKKKLENYKNESEKQRLLLRQTEQIDQSPQIKSIKGFYENDPKNENKKIPMLKIESV